MKDIHIKPSTVRLLLPMLASELADGKATWTPDTVRSLRLAHVGGLPAQPHAPRVIVSRMAKGGVGKTTIIANLGSSLAMMGHKVLMVDGDPQASLTSMMGVDPMDEGIMHVGHLMHQCYMRQPVRIKDSIKPIYANGHLDLIPADITLVNVDSWLNGAVSRELLFARLLRENEAFLCRYEAILVDTAPATSVLTNALMLAGRELLAVVMLNGSSVKALRVLESNIAEINAAIPNLDMGIHIVANGWHGGYADCRQALDRLVKTHGDRLNENALPLSTSFRRQDSLLDGIPSGPVLEREPGSDSAASVAALARSLADRYRILLDGRFAGVSPDAALKGAANG
ncbi:MAG: ParA family protein [Candidatus Methylumidiphilus sp.]